MAANDDKTEAPTGKRKTEARKKGQVAKSPDFNGALVLVVGLFALSSIAPTVVSGTAGAMRQIFAMIATSGQGTSSAGLHQLMSMVMNTMLATAAPLAAVCLAVGLLANVGQVGFRPSFTALRPDFKRINPVSGAKNLFGTRALFETAKALLKVAVVGGVAASALLPQLTNLGASVGTSPIALGSLMSSSAIGIGQRVAFAYIAIGLIDLIYQRKRLSKGLKMTKQEVKEEFKQANGSPEVKGAIRRRQMQAARARMMAAVPQADVVITNPTHYAVALSYDGNHPAPIVVAKGQDHIAAQIRRIATENDVPVVPDPPLARSLHASVDIGQMIPSELYAAVAQVLAFVYRMASKRKQAQA
jgi:flagellar biosynthetic protein FlhB